MPEADFYADPLIYDVLHSPGTTDDITALLRMVRKHRPGMQRSGEGPLTFLEPACGSGRYLLALAAKGYRGVGFDLLEDMVTYAKGKAKREGAKTESLLTYFAADMTDFTRGQSDAWWVKEKVDIAFNFINTIRHIDSDLGLQDHLRCVTSVLAQGGLYYVGISLCDYGNEDITEDMWEGTGQGLHVHQVVQYLPCQGGSGAGERDERVISHMTITDDRGHERHIDSNYILRGYSREEFERAVRESGMKVRCYMESDGREEIDPQGAGYTIAVLETA